MKYRIKNKELEKLIFSIFDEKSVMRCISKQMPKSPEFVFVGDDGQSSTANATLRKDRAHLKPANVAFRIPASEIEAVPLFTPDGWNPYPLVVPPEDKEYLVQRENSMGLKYLEVEGYSSKHTWEDEFYSAGDDVRDWVVAFRELPPLYGDASKQEDEELW